MLLPYRGRKDYAHAQSHISNSAGIEQSDDMKRFLWSVLPTFFGTLYLTEGHRNNHFAAIASDMPCLEVRVFPSLLHKQKLTDA